MPDNLDLEAGFLIRHRHLEPDETGGYIVTSLFVPGLNTQAETFEEAVAIALDADAELRLAREELRRKATSARTAG